MDDESTATTRASGDVAHWLVVSDGGAVFETLDASDASMLCLRLLLVGSLVVAC